MGRPKLAKSVSSSWCCWASRRWGNPAWCCASSRGSSTSTRRAPSGVSRPQHPPTGHTLRPPSSWSRCLCAFCLAPVLFASNTSQRRALSSCWRLWSMDEPHERFWGEPPASSWRGQALSAVPTPRLWSRQGNSVRHNAAPGRSPAHPPKSPTARVEQLCTLLAVSEGPWAPHTPSSTSPRAWVGAGRALGVCVPLLGLFGGRQGAGGRPFEANSLLPASLQRRFSHSPSAWTTQR